MAERHFSAVVILSVIVPLFVATIILIIVVMVVPNSASKTESQSDQLTGNKSEQQLGASLSSQNRSHLLFILGIIFASSLFVLLVVVIVVVCRWARRAIGYTVHNQDFATADHHVYSRQDCQLTKHSGTVPKTNSEKDSSDIKKGSVNSVTVAALPTPPVKTVAVTTQVTPQASKEERPDERCPKFDSVSGVETCPVVQSKNYGTLGRTHLLSTVDEDGYHIDNLGFEPDEADPDEFIASFEKHQSRSTLYEDSFPKIFDKSSENTDIKDKVIHGASAAEIDCSSQGKDPEKQLSKQDSFQGLPPFESFDKYLTLVRLDSSTSIGSVSVEESKKIWESIEEEEDDKVEIQDTSRKE